MLALWCWLLGSLARRPATWLGLAALLGVAPLLARLAPLEPAVGGPDGLGFLAAWSLAAGLLGVGAAVQRLSRAQGFLELLAPRTRFGGELGVLLGAFLAVEAALWLGTLLGGQVPEPGRLGPALVGLGLLGVHLSALGLLVLRLPGGPALRLGALLAAVWVVPGLLGASRTPLAELVRAWFDPARALRGWPAFGDDPWTALSILAPAAALLGAAWLCSTATSAPWRRT